jgi:ketosteroid isomerase-like protein
MSSDGIAADGGDGVLAACTAPRDDGGRPRGAGGGAVGAPDAVDDAVWVLPGTSRIAGTHRGWPEIRDNFLAELGPLSGGTLQAELVDVCGGERFVVAVQHATAQHNGRSLDVTACQLMRIEGGHIVEVHGHYSDQAALDAFWQE